MDMLVMDFQAIGEKLLQIRKSKGMTQAEAAEKANMSLHSYADFERGTVNMRLESFLRVCEAFEVTPNQILVKEEDIKQTDAIKQLEDAPEKVRETAIKLLKVYIDSMQ